MSNVLYGIALTLVVIGSINWGAYAMKFNLVEKLLGGIPYAEKAVYFLVALCGLYVAIATLTTSTPSAYVRNDRNKKY